MMGVGLRETEGTGEMGKEYKRTLLLPSIEFRNGVIWDRLWNLRSMGVYGCSPRLLSRQQGIRQDSRKMDISCNILGFCRWLRQRSEIEDMCYYLLYVESCMMKHACVQLSTRSIMDRPTCQQNGNQLISYAGGRV